jgi:hypothetical protein
MPTRRDLLSLLAAAALPAARAAESATLVASWAEGDRCHLGQLRLGEGGVRVHAYIELPTRAHGLALEADGSVLVAARRPGDWLLRWHPANKTAQWHWVDDDRRLNGHVLCAPDSGGQGAVWTTETDQADARGLIGLRDARTLAKTAEWPTHGMDPHAMLVLPERVGAVPAGALLVANGGIPTQSETGRSHRDLSRMDPSLVALDPRSGRLLGQWRLADPRLSIRHLAFDPVSRQVGIALQAEHDHEAARRDAPLLGIWNARGLEAAPPMPQAMGYGGDVCARPDGGFFVSATRAHAVLATDAEGRVVDRIALRDAGALAAHGTRWWGAGSQAAMVAGQALAAPATLRLDNHWRWLA